jgi:hypothetical protein
MGRRGEIAAFNALLGVAASTAFTAIAAGAATVEEIRAAFFVSWWAGLGAGATVAAGAVLGPRPPLDLVRCVLAQGIIVATSAAGAWIGSLFPSEFAAAQDSVRRFLAHRGIVLGAAIGTVVGTATEIFHVYRMRRRKDEGTR